MSKNGLQGTRYICQPISKQFTKGIYVLGELLDPWRGSSRTKVTPVWAIMAQVVVNNLVNGGVQGLTGDFGQCRPRQA